VNYTTHRGKCARNHENGESIEAVSRGRGAQTNAPTFVLGLLLSVACQSGNSSPVQSHTAEPTTSATPSAAASTIEAPTKPPEPKIDSCDFPAKPASSLEETAWRLFVAANCTDHGQLTWESWKTQACLDHPDDCPKVGRLHASVATLLARKKVQGNQGPARTAGCEPMTTSAKGTPKQLLPFVPTNLSKKPVFCEEVTINPAEYEYGQKNGLLTVDGQMTFLKAGSTIAFPTDAIEIKADWVPAASFTDATFDCSKPSPDVYLEEIQGTCYALAGVHISSKLYPNWLWATFEPQFAVTNPNRCKAELYGACNDSWGSNPATSTGANTEATKGLTALFDGAGEALSSAFRNYRLTGVQIAFDDPKANKGQLGSSFVEFNAQVLPGQASCITCHSYAQRTLKAGAGFKVGQTPPGGPYTPKGNTVGTPSAPPPDTDFKSLDFSWFLGFGVPQK
jgi:hypothetical protein